MKGRIGLDFDNTIVCYDDVFKKVCLQFPDYPVKAERGKSSVKEYLVSRGMEEEWTELQGMVYGPYMEDARPYSRAISVLKRLEALEYELYIISHRTKYPYRGERFDLHQHAREWIDNHLGEIAQFKGAKNAYFLESLDEKIGKINELGCDYFMDDLKSVLSRDDIEEGVTKILFSAQCGYNEQTGHYSVVRTWSDFESLVLADG